MLPVETDISQWRWPKPETADELIATDRMNGPSVMQTKSAKQNQEDAA